MAFSTPLVLLRAYMSPEDKEKYSNAVPQSFDEIMCGVMVACHTEITYNIKLRPERKRF